MPNTYNVVLLKDGGKQWTVIDRYNAEIFLYKPWRPNVFLFQFKIIINGLIRSFRFIWIPISWVYGH